MADEAVGGAGVAEGSEADLENGGVDRGPLKPIPPDAKPGGGAERGPDGKFVAKDAAPGAPHVSEDTGDDPKDYPIATLPGMPDETLEAPRPKAVRTKRGAERLLEAAAPQATDGEGNPVGEAQAAAAPAEAPPAGAPTTTAPEAPAAPAAKYKVRAKDESGQPVFEEFESEEKFHENWRTIRGMYRGEVSKRTNAEDMARRNYQAAVDWKAKAEAYEKGELKPAAQGAASVPGVAPNGRATAAESQAAASAAAATGAPEDDVISRIDWREYRRVKAEAVRDYGDEAPDIMQAWLVREAARHIHTALDTKYNARLEEMVRPAKERDAIIEHGRAIGEAMDDLAANMVYEDGTEVYPEFADNAARQEIGQVIAQRAKDGVGWDYLKSNKGIHESVLLWRDWRRMTKRAWSPNGNGHAATPPAATPPIAHPQPGVDSAMRSIEARNAGVVAGRSMPPRPSNAGNSPAQSIRDALKNAAKVGPLGWPE